MYRIHTHRYRYISWILISLIFCSCASTNKTYSGTPIELLEKNGMHFVEVTINGIKTKLLVDTGASKSILDISQAKTYGFNYMFLNKNNYIGLGGLVDIYIVYDYKVEEFFIPFVGSDLSEIQEFFIKDNIHISGILGTDFLEQHKANIDFEANKLYLNWTNIIPSLKLSKVTGLISIY